jgi:hypothetical protein
LEQLPRQFKASDIRQVRGIKDKRSSELFAAITRWIEAGSVKKKARGAYVSREAYGRPNCAWSPISLSSGWLRWWRALIEVVGGCAGGCR